VKTPQLQREHGKYQDQYSAGYQHDEVHVHFSTSTARNRVSAVIAM
jgi:hypothetical protein